MGLEEYAHGMTYDSNGKPIPKFSPEPTVQLPVNVSYHESTTIQTHNAVSVAANTSSNGTNTWVDSLGYNSLSITLQTDSATTPNYLNVLWSNDGVNQHGYENPLASANTQYRSINVPTKARYFKVQIGNGDGTNAHTVSAWAYLQS